MKTAKKTRKSKVIRKGLGFAPEDEALLNRIKGRIQVEASNMAIVRAALIAYERLLIEGKG
jgi:hypothetical protein